MKFELPTVYGGVQIFKICYASTFNEAAKKLDCSVYYINNYAYKNVCEVDLNGIYAYMDSGYIIYDIGRKDLFKKVLPIDEIEKIIDDYNDKKRRTS